MASPDVTPYVDLTVFDVDAQEVFEAALAVVLERLPGFVPNEANMEVVLLEALAVEVSELVFAANRLPGTIVEVLLRLYGITRDFGAPAAVNLTFTVSDTIGHEIPVGTFVRVELADGNVLDFRTDTSILIPVGSNTGTVYAVADTSTAAPNGLPAGTPVELLTGLAYVDTVSLASSPVGGRDEESAESMMERGQALLQRLVSTLVTPQHFVAAAAFTAGVVRAAAADNYDPGQAGSPGAHPGHITVAVAGSNGDPLNTTQKAALLADLSGQALAMLAIHIADVTVTNVNVTATVIGLPGYAAADLQEAITETLTAYLHPDTWPFGRAVYRNELISVIDSVDGVDRVVTIDAPAADVTLTGIAPLARVGTVTITVQAS